jgi:hypothetical protein
MQMILPDDGTMQNVGHMFDILEIEAPILKAKSRVSAKTKQDRSPTILGTALFGLLEKGKGK